MFVEGVEVFMLLVGDKVIIVLDNMLFYVELGG